MPVFTIETTYRLPVYRQQTYEAATMEEAWRLAIDDDDWSEEKCDYESAGKTYVTGIWSGANAAYSGAAQPCPSHYVETPHRIASHFERLPSLRKVLRTPCATDALALAYD